MADLARIPAGQSVSNSVECDSGSGVVAVLVPSGVTGVARLQAYVAGAWTDVVSRFGGLVQLPSTPGLAAVNVAGATKWRVTTTLPQASTTDFYIQFGDTVSTVDWAPLRSQGRSKASGTTYLSTPGFGVSSVTTQALSAGVRYFYRLWFEAPVIVDQLAFEVTTAGAGVARVGLMTADFDWQPSSVLADSGDVDVSTTGVKTYTLASPVTVPVGRVLAVFHPNIGVTVREASGGFISTDFVTTLGTNPVIARRNVTLAYGALDTTAWNAAQAGATERIGVFVRAQPA
jgi:hypothetical protein